MSDQYNRNNDISPSIRQQQPQTTPTRIPTQDRAQYLQRLHAQAMILHRELSERLTFLGDYIDYALCLIDSNPGPWQRVINSAQTLLNNILDLGHSAGILFSLSLQPGLEDLQKLDNLTLRIGEFIGRTGWMYLGRDCREIQAWVSEAQGLLGSGRQVMICVEETIRKVKGQAGKEGVVIRGIA